MHSLPLLAHISGCATQVGVHWAIPFESSSRTSTLGGSVQHAFVSASTRLDGGELLLKPTSDGCSAVLRSQLCSWICSTPQSTTTLAGILFLGNTTTLGEF